MSFVCDFSTGAGPCNRCRNVTARFCYQDEIIVIGQANLKEVFRRLKEANLRLSPEKCQFFKKKLLYLGRRVTGKGSSHR